MTTGEGKSSFREDTLGHTLTPKQQRTFANNQVRRSLSDGKVRFSMKDAQLAPEYHVENSTIEARR